MSFLYKTVIEWLLAKAAAFGIKFIKAQIKKSKRNIQIDEEVNAMDDAVKAIEEFRLVHGYVAQLPMELERGIKDAARTLNSNFID